LVYDITSQKSFENITKWRDGFLEHASPGDPSTFPFVLLGNKLDKEEDRKVTLNSAKAWCKENHNMPAYETSATQNVSVDDAFIEMAKMAIKRES
jgi:GTPase SAR1 family protein